MDGCCSLDFSDCRRDGQKQAAAAMVGSRTLSPQKDGRTGDALPLPNTYFDILAAWNELKTTNYSSFIVDNILVTKKPVQYFLFFIFYVIFPKYVLRHI
jgi:hypothetical protein